MTDNVLILGAGSAIARAVCNRLACRGCRLLLAGRDLGEMETLAADLRVRYGIAAAGERFDALDFESLPAFVEDSVRHFSGELSGVVLCYGSLPQQERVRSDPRALRNALDLNFTSAVVLLEAFSSVLERRRGGFIAAISSVAGDRGRQSNYLYGAAKGGLSIYLQGLRNRLAPAGVHVLTVKPGFVDTPMTRGLINPNSPLMASAERVGADIDRAIRRRSNVLYTPWFWRPIMAVIRCVPESIFKRLKL